MKRQHLKLDDLARLVPNVASRFVRQVMTETSMQLNAALITKEDIQQKAYQKWEQAGKPAGDGLNFWLEAEKELLQTS